MPKLPARAPIRWASLALAGLLAACGGGGSSSDGAPPGGSGGGGLSVSFGEPPAQGVVSDGEALTLTARVTVNGAAAADGTTVRFSAVPGPFTATGTTQDGWAQATFSGATAGRQELSASATVGGQTVTAARVMYLRPTPRPLALLVPAYFYPAAGGSAWDQLAASAAAHPALQLTAIMNPANGVFATADPNYVRAASRLVAAGGRVLGYVHTRYGSGERTLAQVQANVDAYLTLYGRGVVSGFFIDEMASDPARLPFYRALFDYIKGRDASLQIVGNPGAVPAAAYAEAAEVLVTLEGSGGSFQDYDPRTTPWLYAQPNARLAALVHNVAGCAAMQTAVRQAATARSHLGMLYVTDQEYDPVTRAGNPWGALPAYWNELVLALDAANRGLPPPAC